MSERMRDVYQNKKVKMLLLGCILLLLCFWHNGMKTHAAAPYKSNGRLKVQENQVVNKKGKPFIIKGVSTHGIAWYPEYVNKKAFRTLRDKWGVNTIRLAMYTAEYQGYCTDGDKNALKKQIDNGVQYATDLGMYVIIDWHILSDGNPLQYQSEAEDFFREMAKKYASYGNVMFEICNEPNGSEGSWNNIKSYAEKIIQTIRRVNSKAIIIVGTPTWSQDVDIAQADPIKGKNIAYAFHFYAGTHKADMRSKLEAVLKKGFPVIVTEFGISDASGNGSIDKTEGKRWMKLLDRYKVGRVCWNLSNKNESSALLKSSCTKKSGWKTSDLSASGKWLVKTYTGKTSGTGTNSQKAPEAKSKSGKVTLEASIQKVQSWESNGKIYTQYSLVIENTGKKTCKSWKANLKFQQAFHIEQSWCANFKKKGKVCTVSPMSWNRKIKKNETAEIGFIVTSSKKETVKSLKLSAS